MSDALGNIEHVIVLMFENRSFDHLLGAMPKVDGVLGPDGKVKPELYNTMQSLKKASSTSNPPNPSVPPTPIVPGAESEGKIITHDFNHDFGDGHSQDLFGPGTTAVIRGQPQNNPTTYPATNSGFLRVNSRDGIKDVSVMTYFEWKSMKVFHTLAESFLVCDQWHCDVPGHTAANRAYMHCATTGDLGLIDNDGVQAQTQSPVMVNRETIFERIERQGQTWKMYYMDSNCDTYWLNLQVLSQQYEKGKTNVTEVPISVFFDDLKNGTLPYYSFIMTFNDIPGFETSMHPQSTVINGENLLACIYNAFKASPHWKNTLLIVNFDENGGIYDHKPVPGTQSPDVDPMGPQPPPVWTWQDEDDTPKSFDFTVLGPRIPVLLISPWLNAGVCSLPFQNTSILRFLQDRLKKPAPANWLTHRDQNAKSIAEAFGRAMHGSATLRTNYPDKIDGYPDGITCQQIESSDALTAEQLSAAPPAYIVNLTREYLGPLPGHPDSGKPVTRDFATVGEMRAYAKERKDAALAYIQANSRRAN